MGQALADVLPLAAAVAIFPVPIVAVVLLLASDRGRVKGLAFVIGWLAGLAAVGAVVLLLAGEAGASEAGEHATWVDVLLLGLGLLLLVLAVKQWRGRPSAGGETAMPGWMSALDDFTAAKAAGAGCALSALNPKNVLLTVAAAAEIAGAGLAAGQQVAVLVAFVLIASAGVLTPLVFSLTVGDRSREPLDAVKSWMARNNAVIMTVLFVVIGVKLIGDAIV
jgi:threonine/homoserine/homoserine lactone efflux protein